MNMLYQTVKLADFLTEAEIAKARRLFKQARRAGENVNALIVKDIIVPNLARINEALRQKQDPRYLAYAVEYVLMREIHPRPLVRKPSWRR